MTETRERFIQAATTVFAERGFYGASIAAVAEDLPFTKQALLHHFGSKEKLYGEVLKRISDRLTAELDVIGKRHTEPRARFEETFIEFYRSSLANPRETALLMRELLDNKRRAETSKSWYLKPLLNTLADLAASIPSARLARGGAALAFVYQLLGAISYFVVSEPTLSTMYGDQDFEALQAGFEKQLRILITSRLDAGF
ncbi:MAG: TetR/AcrR family transcriptional regulator [Pseudomonadota bacterium]